MLPKVLILFLTLIPIEILGQNYQKMNFNSGIWITHYSIKEGEIKNAQHFCNGDTLINDTLYFKLYEYAITGYPPIFYPDTTLDYVGAIRNNSKKQIELIRSWQNSPEIIYDFNLNIGDTIITGYGSDWGISVYDIDSVNICGTYNKRYIIFSNPSPGLSFIEGIGCTWGFIDPIPFFESSSMLECYTEMENNQCDKCDLLLRMPNMEMHHNELVIFPNPIHDQIQIYSEQAIDHVMVFSLSGLKKIEQDGDHNKSMTIQVDFVPGIYFLNVQCARGTYNKKIIVK